MHHQRRKSGHGLTASNSSTDIRKRPGMTRRHTPINSQKLGRSQRDREKAWQESWEDERESFPQYCMTCEKQFVPQDDMFLYCSDNCRRIDQNSTSPGVSVRNYSGSSYSYTTGGASEPRDIVPRASPSRPSSMLSSNSPPATPGTTTYTSHHHHTSAVAALRSLNVRPPSPPSPTVSGSSIWPFSRSAANSPGNSYSRPSGPLYSTTYDGVYTYDMGSASMVRPLPCRNPSHASRPRSIELVTPMISR